MTSKLDTHKLHYVKSTYDYMRIHSYTSPLRNHSPTLPRWTSGLRGVKSGLSGRPVRRLDIEAASRADGTPDGGTWRWRLR